ncbi:hypothetical protein BDZ45DRAFT_362945 [Acephala macrosclerotiorum]|nr:hypothetical protein BDZ45DRAFT_362945 [Acephala macrosclerotiorum]
MGISRVASSLTPFLNTFLFWKSSLLCSTFVLHSSTYSSPSLQKLSTASKILKDGRPIKVSTIQDFLVLLPLKMPQPKTVHTQSSILLSRLIRQDIPLLTKYRAF